MVLKTASQIHNPLAAEVFWTNIHCKTMVLVKLQNICVLGFASFEPKKKVTKHT